MNTSTSYKHDINIEELIVKEEHNDDFEQLQSHEKQIKWDSEDDVPIKYIKKQEMTSGNRLKTEKKFGEYEDVRENNIQNKYEKKEKSFVNFAGFNIRVEDPLHIDQIQDLVIKERCKDTYYLNSEIKRFDNDNVVTNKHDIVENVSTVCSNEPETMYNHVRVDRVVLSVNGAKYFTCKYCSYASRRKYNVVKHEKAHVIKSYSCKICDRIFTDVCFYKKHKRTHAGDMRFTCDVCDCKYRSRSGLAKHKRTHTGEEPYACDICVRTFSSIYTLRMHVSIHANMKPYSCDICHRKYFNNSSLKNHKRTHTGEKPFTCNICHLKFSSSSHLNTHKITHMEESPYSCDVCHRKFTKNGSLTVHKTIHAGEQPFNCDVCDRKFSRNSNLSRHMRTHTGDKPYSCGICDLKFSDKTTVKLHMRTHTGEKPYHCSACSSKFSRRCTLIKHMKLHNNSKT